MLIKELQNAGLSEREAKVYLALLELGETNINRLAKKSKVKRTTVYLIMDSLKEKALVSHIKKGNKTFFYAEDPRNLERRIEEKRKAIEKAMPELLSFTNLIDKKPEIRYFEGKEGIKEVYLDTLKYPEQEILAWFSEAFIDFDKEFFDEIYIPKRVKNKIFARVILPDNEITRNFKEIDEKALRKTKLIAQKKFDIRVEISLYGKNKIAIMSYEEEIALIIESNKIFEALKCIFEFMWEVLP